MSGPYAARKPGWFSCGYGPFRRLLGRASEESELMFALGEEVPIRHALPRGGRTNAMHGMAVHALQPVDRQTPP